jgi:hypothetical protein
MNFDFHFSLSYWTAVTFKNTYKAFIAKILGRICQENLFGIFVTRVGADNEYNFDRYAAEAYNMAQ